MVLGSYPQRRIPWPTQLENLPQQKACVYFFLLFCTVTLIYFYSYPLSTDDFQNLSIQQESTDAKNVFEQESSELEEHSTKGHQNDLSTLLPFTSSGAERTNSDGFLDSTTRDVNVPDDTRHKNGMTKVSEATGITVNISALVYTSTKDDRSYTESSLGDIAGYTYGENWVSMANYTSQKMDAMVTESIGTRSEDGDVPAFTEGFLVYSNHCRIPDIDPMHPSIRKFVDRSPPLNCREGHEPLTRTDGNVLILDTKQAGSRASGTYSCCYRSIFRDRDGETDDGVGFGEKCTHFTSKTIIKNDFIKVECQLENGTLFHTDFHSFVRDHPAVEERCKNFTDPGYSVMIIGIDSMSRMNMHRQLNSTYRYMIEELGATEMYGFNKVGDNTFPNLVPILTGYDMRELSDVCWESNDEPLDDCNFIWKRFSRAGYRTLYAEDNPSISSFNYIKEGFHKQPTDYYFRHFIKAYEAEQGREKPLNCYLCVGPVSETEAVLHWTAQFAEHFSNRAVFSFSWINSLTHDDLNKGSAGDHMYQMFFRKLHRSGSLNSTIVIVMGDHGMRWGSIRKTYIGRLEERLPILLIALPEKFRKDYPDETAALNINSHRLVTPFDLHATLVNVLHLKSQWKFTNPDKVNEGLSSNFTNRARSLFHPIPNDRSCDDAFIEEHWCTCETSLPIDTNEEDVKSISEFLVDRINAMLRPVSDVCATLTLNETSDARFWDPPSEHEGHTADDTIYTVVIKTQPGAALFEGTAKVSSNNDNPKLLGTISRLNLYGNQSYCVPDASLKKYCYCS